MLAIISLFSCFQSFEMLQVLSGTCFVSSVGYGTSIAKLGTLVTIFVHFCFSCFVITALGCFQEKFGRIDMVNFS